jgi:hypothetical protein
MCEKLRFHVMEGMDLSPYEMMFGWLPTMPLDLILGQVETKNYKTDIAKNIISNYKKVKLVADKHKLRQKFNYNKKRNLPPFKIGDLVFWEHKRIVGYGDGSIPLATKYPLNHPTLNNPSG